MMGSTLFPTLIHPDDLVRQMDNYQHCFNLADGKSLRPSIGCGIKAGITIGC